MPELANLEENLRDYPYKVVKCGPYSDIDVALVVSGHHVLVAAKAKALQSTGDTKILHYVVKVVAVPVVVPPEPVEPTLRMEEVNGG